VLPFEFFLQQKVIDLGTTAQWILETHGHNEIQHFTNVFDASRTIEQYRQFHNEISMKFYQMSVEKQALEQKVLRLELELQTKYEL
jgi:dihydroorotase